MKNKYDEISTKILFKQFVNQVYNQTFLKDAELTEPVEKEKFKSDMLVGVDKLYDARNKYKNKPALIMGLGPSLLEINKEKYQNHLKITCNHFYRVPDFFDDSFKPDIWCAANSFSELEEPFKICLERNIESFITIPIRKEFNSLLDIARNEDKMDLVTPWLWEQRLFQNILAHKFNVNKIYSRCNTITNHMIAYALYLGCNPITVTGFDLSYKNALKKYGITHAGFNDNQRAEDMGLDIDAFDNPQEKAQILHDLSYLCHIAKANNQEIINLSHESNELPLELTANFKWSAPTHG